MKPNHRFKWLALAALTLILTGCPRTEPPTEPTEQVLDAPGLIAAVQDRGRLLERMDASLEAKISGLGGPFRGKFFGTLLMERGDVDQLKLWIQTYSIVGAPVLELITDGDRVEIFSPLDNTVYVNFSDYAPTGEVEEFPLASFTEIAFPLELVMQQIGMVWGIGFDPQLRYQLGDLDGAYLLSEWRDQQLLRRFEFSRPQLFLQNINLYQAGALFGQMECSGHAGGAGPEAFVPTHFTLSQGDVKLSLALSHLRANDEVTGPAITFRKPMNARIILLTPPVP